MKIPTFMNFADALYQRALHDPDKLAYIFFSDGNSTEIRLTYGELDAHARTIAAYLRDLIPTGSRALLLFHPGFDYIKAFFGCLYAGVVAVPAYPPRLNKPDSRLQAIVADAQINVALTTSQVLSKIQKRLAYTPELANLNWLAIDENSAQNSSSWQVPLIQADDLAFLQYTSGSTSNPKGVILTHHNLLHNSALIYQAFNHTNDSLGVIWLPPYHDMGLIGGILQPVYGGFPVVLMSPVSFLQRPIRWLQAISQYRATTSGGPNFAYELCINKTTHEERADLDLSSWEVAFNGAEPIRSETLDHFARTFAPYGFRREAFYPCYGLAEATLLVSGGSASSAPILYKVETKALEEGRVVSTSSNIKKTRTFVSCGKTFDDQKIVIVHPETLSLCPPGQVGEIWVMGDSVAQGYWNQLETSADVFEAYLTDTQAGPFLRTGDLGFINDGELFITGRIKDVIIIRGRNHYPQDIEQTAEQSSSALEPDSGAAFSIEANGEERLVIVYELKRTQRKENTDEIATAVRQAVAEKHNLQVYTIAFLMPRSILKTSSGKIRRHACRTSFLNNTLQIINLSVLKEESSTNTKVTASEIEPFIRKALIAVQEPTAQLQLLRLYLQEVIARILHLPPSQVDIEQPLTTFGIDSLTSVELTHQIEASLNVQLSMVNFLQGITISQIASQMLPRIKTVATIASVSSKSRRKVASIYPASHGQKALWYLYSLSPESSAYHIACAVQIQTKLNLAALQQATQILVDRHPALRTTFFVQNGRVVQQVHEEITACFSTQDVSDWDESTLKTHLHEEAKRPFDIERDTLLRIRLFTRPGKDDVLLLVAHHIITDLWSLANIINELGKLYKQGSVGIPARLPSPSMQYADYVHWQTQMLSSEQGNRLWAYWQETLSGNLPVLNLPTDRTRPPFQTYHGASITFKLPATLTAKFKALSHNYKTTLYTTLLAAFQILLHRYSGQTDIIVGSPTTGRSQAAWAKLIGYFVNPIVIRGNLTGNPTFLEYLAQVRQTVLDALAHQDYPFPLLVEKLQPERDPSRSPIFQAMFALQTTPALDDKNLAAFTINGLNAQMDIEGIVLNAYTLELQTTQFDLTLMMAEIDEDLAASFQYSTDLFDEPTIARMTRHFQTLLEGIVSNPKQRVSDLPLLTKSERQQLLNNWNDTHEEHLNNHLTIHELFEAQVRKSPDSIAVLFNEEQISYDELNARANQLAGYLRHLGIGPEDRVAVYMERSIEMIIAILGILKSGGAYVPVDPDYPKERVVFMLADTQAPVTITQQQLWFENTTLKTQVIFIETIGPIIAQQARSNLTNRTLVGNLSYVLYTSGSTGQPKGVAIIHRSVTALITWAAKIVSPQDIQGVLAGTSFCFDLSVYELFLPLSQGGTVVLAHNVLHLLSLPFRHAVTLINSVPSVIDELLKAAEIPDSVRVVNLAGEPLKRSLVQKVYEHKNVRDVYNLYGPSEDTTYSTFARLVCEDNIGEPTIGKPIANTEVYVLDAYLNPVPIGVPGELYLSGDGLARGYLRRSSLTAKRFIPNPYSQKPGSRLYRTGDLTCYRASGELEFLGRIDHQIKLRGYRIELEEIEAILNQHPNVQMAIVAAKRETDQLIAYINPQGQKMSSDVYHQYLRKQLPVYMIPSHFVFLETFPLTPNGKVDRKALPTSLVERPDLAAGFVVPQAPLESLLADIWCQVLSVEQVGIHDNFFALGGHSLLALQIITRIRERFQVELSMRAFFEMPTVNQVAKILSITKYRETVPEPIPPRGEEFINHTPLSYAQEQLWFLAQLERDNPSYNVSVAVRLSGQLDVGVMKKSLGEIIRRHDALRTYFAMSDGKPVQIISPANEQLPLSIMDFSHLSGSQRTTQVRELIQTQAREPFSLDQGPLLRISILKLDEVTHIIPLTIHHSIVDLWSLKLFIGEIATLYEAFIEEKPSPLPELTIQYPDFAYWQRRWLSGDILNQQLTYWKQQLSDAPTAITLPFDYPRPVEQNFEGATEQIKLPQELCQQLRHLSRESGTTLFMTLLAAYATWLSYYSGQEDIIIGSSVANRKVSQVESLIGFFVNTVAIRAQCKDNDSFLSFLAQIRKTALDAYAHQDVPFARVVEALQLTRDPNHTPVFQVMFDFQEVSLSQIKFSDLTLTPIEPEITTAKFDLSMSVREDSSSLTVSLEYKCSLFEASTIKGMISSFEQLLHHIVAQPQLQLHELKNTLSKLTRRKETAMREKRSSLNFKRVQWKPVHIPQKRNDKVDDQDETAGDSDYFH